MKNKMKLTNNRIKLIKNKMKSTKIMMILLLSVLFVSCEENVVDTSGIKYKEQLVIKAFIFAGENAKNIIITRTLHPLEKYNAEKALVKNAEAAIIHNNRRYNLTYNENTQSYENVDIVFMEGEKYELVVNWRNLKATATTTIPKFEVVRNYYSFEYVEYWEWGWWQSYWAMNINAIVRGDKNAVYAISYSGSGDYYYFDYDKLIDASRNTADTFKVVYNDMYKYSNIKDSVTYINFAKRYSYRVTGFAHQLWDYNRTLENRAMDMDILFGNSLNVKWNIEGDGIGLFIGSNQKEFKLE